jgi:hypothetical protein
MILQARVLVVALAFPSLFAASSADAQTQPAQQQRAPALNQPANPPAGSGAATVRTTKPLLTQRCEYLGAKFKALDKRNLAYSNVLLADTAAAKGEELCPTNPERGIELIEAAYRDLGLQPPG